MCTGGGAICSENERTGRHFELWRLWGGDVTDLQYGKVCERIRRLLTCFCCCRLVVVNTRLSLSLLWGKHATKKLDTSVFPRISCSSRVASQQNNNQKQEEAARSRKSEEGQESVIQSHQCESDSFRSLFPLLYSLSFWCLGKSQSSDLLFPLHTKSHTQEHKKDTKNTKNSHPLCTYTVYATSRQVRGCSGKESGDTHPAGQFIYCENSDRNIIIMKKKQNVKQKRSWRNRHKKSGDDTQPAD